MSMPMYKIRIIANACITRYTNGEGTIELIVDNYNMATDDKDAVLTEIYTKRPDLQPTPPS